ncbi:molybdenum cofactor guanylyltransferase [Salidesulfovibrio onnuriiensis]|uniref:molybdenum cofactor guanylyltransferase n=1 Tax=Salidesulfovibrio onnuriiensis TaxID=2583823 RepID=UPI00202B8ABD|nr:molybdenum cofactor guanylyltransferase [Salidesulfovibrio onnuriiensis]
MEIACTILAGGLGTRMGGVRKAFLEVGGVRIIDRLLEACRPLFQEILVSCRKQEGFDLPGVTLVPDTYDARSSLTGIQAGLAACRASHTFVTACDAPFLQTGLVQRLLQQAEPDADVVIPLKDDGYMEPLCAIYSKRCLPHIEAQLAANDYKVLNIFDKVRLKQVPVDLLRPGDPELLSFESVNTPEELEAARKRL